MNTSHNIAQAHQHPPAPVALSAIPAFQRCAPSQETLDIAATASIQFLGQEWHNAIVALNGKLRKSLTPSGQQHFLRQLRVPDLNAHHGPIIGVVAKHKSKKSNPLLGCMLVSYPRFLQGDPVLHGYPLEKNAFEMTALFRAVTVDPAFNGLGFAQEMLKNAEDVACASGHMHAIARIDDQNFNSQGGFKKAGFSNIGQKFVGPHGTASHWHKSINTFFMKSPHNG